MISILKYELFVKAPVGPDHQLLGVEDDLFRLFSPEVISGIPAAVRIAVLYQAHKVFSRRKVFKVHLLQGRKVLLLYQGEVLGHQLH